MQSTKYLYNIEPSELINLNYVDAIHFKLNSAKQLIHHLIYDFHYSERDEQRISAVHSTQSFNRNLLTELNL